MKHYKLLNRLPAVALFVIIALCVLPVPVSGSQTSVTNGDDLQAALNSAGSGDTIRLEESIDNGSSAGNWNFTVKDGVTLEIPADIYLPLYGTNGPSTLRIQSGGAVQNGGTIYTSGGTIAIEGGSLTVSGQARLGMDTGTLRIAAGAELMIEAGGYFGSGTTWTNQGTITNRGALRIVGYTSPANEGTIHNYGEIEAYRMANASGAALNNHGVIKISDTLTNEGTLDNKSGAELHLALYNEEGSELVNSGSVNNSGTIFLYEDLTSSRITGNDVAGTGSVTRLSSPGVPSNLTATPGDGQITLRWEAPDNGGKPITSYWVYLDDEYYGFSETSSYVINGLTNGRTYLLHVCAQNEIGIGSNSSQISAAPVQLPPQPALEPKSGSSQSNGNSNSNNANSDVNPTTAAGVNILANNGTLITVSFDQQALAELRRQSNGNVTVTIVPKTNLSAAAKKLIGTRPVCDITVNGGGKAITDLGGGKAIVSIPYTPGKNEAAGGLYAVYVDEKGNTQRIADSVYDSSSGCVIFTTTHFSLYGVGYTAPSAKFTDIASHWGKESIDYAVGRGLLFGKSKITFAPDAPITRGMLVTALARLAGIEVKAYTTIGFSDLKADSFFRPYLEWAYGKDTGNKKSASDRAVTREEMAAIFSNFAKTSGYTLPVTREAVVYTDASGIGGIYQTAVTDVQRAGILQGDSKNQFHPKAEVTRAEFCTMLHRYIKLTIGPATAQGFTKNDDGILAASTQIAR